MATAIYLHFFPLGLVGGGENVNKGFDNLNYLMVLRAWGLSFRQGMSRSDEHRELT